MSVQYTFLSEISYSSTQDRNPNIGQWDPEDSARARMSFIMGAVSPTGLVIVNSNPTIDLLRIAKIHVCILYILQLPSLQNIFGAVLGRFKTVDIT